MGHFISIFISILNKMVNVDLSEDRVNLWTKERAPTDHFSFHNGFEELKFNTWPMKSFILKSHPSLMPAHDLGHFISIFISILNKMVNVDLSEDRVNLWTKERAPTDHRHFEIYRDFYLVSSGGGCCGHVNAGPQYRLCFVSFEEALSP